MPRVYLAYGTLDKAFKYGADVVWVQRKTPRIEWYASHKSDIEQLGMMGFFDQGNVFNSALNLEGDQNQLALITQSELNILVENGSGYLRLSNSGTGKFNLKVCWNFLIQIIRPHPMH